MAQPEVRMPTVGTLKKYGLTATDWLAILERQGWVCAICERVPVSGRWVTDHDHVSKWKKLNPERRRRHVRGVLCSYCNSHCIGRFMTLAKAINTLAYFERHHGSLEINKSLFE